MTNTPAPAKATRASTLEDVARLAGVSMKTVSRVVNREPNVRASTQLAVEAAIRELDYRPNVSARNLASEKARLIVLIYDDPAFYEAPSSGYIINLQEGALQACKNSGFELLIHPCNFRNRQVGLDLLTLIRRIRPTGIIIAPPLSNMSSIVDPVASTSVPFVLLSPGTPTFPGFAVNTTDKDACAEMITHLAGLGHRRIAFIKGNSKHRAVGQRFLGYKKGLRAAGLELDERLITQGDNSIGSGERCAALLLALTARPTAIFAANDDMAAGVLRTALQQGLKVPDELSVAGCDDIPLARQVYPALTTIRQPLADMAERAANVLIKEARKDTSFTGSVVIPAGLRIRESTGPARSRR